MFALKHTSSCSYYKSCHLCVLTYIYSAHARLRAHLGRKVVARADHALRLRVKPLRLGEAKVADLQPRRRAAIQQRVVQLQIAVTYALRTCVQGNVSWECLSMTSGLMQGELCVPATAAALPCSAAHCSAPALHATDRVHATRWCMAGHVATSTHFPLPHARLAFHIPWLTRQLVVSCPALGQ